MTKSEARAIANRTQRAQEILIDLTVELRRTPNELPLDLARRVSDVLHEVHQIGQMAGEEIGK